MKRRQVLGMGATALAGLSLSNQAMASSKEGKGPKCQKKTLACTGGCQSQIGVILYTLRDFLKTEDDIAKTLEKVAKIGYKTVELTSVGAVSNSKLVQLLKDNGLQAISCHDSFDGMQKNPEEIIAKYQELGCKLVGVGSMPGRYRKGGEGYRQFAKDASKVGKRLAKDGMKFVYHNHNFEFEHFDGICGLDILAESSDTGFNFEIDTHWVVAGGGDPAEYIRKNTGRVPIIHMKDFIMHKGERMFAEVGHGNMNWKAIIAAGRAAGVQHFVVEQDRCLRDPFESIAMSYNFMKSCGLS